MPTYVYTDGNDTVSHSTATSDTLIFIGGNDRLNMFLGTVQAFMGEGNDLIDLRGGTTTAYGESGDDRFEILVGATVYGGGGADLFSINGGSGLIANGGADADRFNFGAAAAYVMINGGAGDDDFAGYGFASTGSIYGDAGNDMFTGFGEGISIYGGEGNDVYRVNVGGNASFGEISGEGKDTVQVMRGTSFTLADNIENILVGTYAGSDLTTATLTGNGIDNAITGHNNDETINGLGGHDRLYGKGGVDTLNGGEGNDILDGGAGNDALNGGDGNDRLNGRVGDDTMVGGDGNDIYWVDSAGDVVTENALQGTDTIRTTISLQLSDNVENGVMEGSGNLIMYGNAIGNVINGNSGANGIAGFEGNDTLNGGAGTDVLVGGLDDDTLSGGADNDTLIGSEGVDTLTGGAGDDTFRWDAVTDSPGGLDQITDFLSVSGAGGDKLDLSVIDANTGVAGDQAFTYSNGTATANSIWYANPIDNGDGTYEVTLRADVNGDTTADWEIQVHFLSTSLFADDIIL